MVDDHVEKRREAIHEAGHAVVMWYYRRAIKEITLKHVAPLNPSVAIDGFVKNVIDGGDPEPLPDFLKPGAEEYAVIKWAGWAANASFEDQLDDHLEVFGATEDVKQVVALGRCLQKEAEAVKEWVRSMQGAAYALLQRKDLREAVEHLAAHLRRQKRLLGKEAERIIEDAGAQQRQL